MAWLGKHGKAQIDPPVKAALTALKSEGIVKFGVAGYCFGGQYSLLKLSWQLS